MELQQKYFYFDPFREITYFTSYEFNKVNTGSDVFLLLLLSLYFYCNCILNLSVSKIRQSHKYERNHFYTNNNSNK